MKRSSTPYWRRPYVWLLVVMALGGFFRFNNLNWDKFHSFHPDERNILGQTSGIQASNGFRVTFFAYGQLPVYLYRSTSEIISVPKALSPRGVQPVLQWSWWLFLILLFGGMAWVLSREKWRDWTFPVAFGMFGLAVVFILFPIFGLWFGRPDGFRLTLASAIYFPAGILLSVFCLAKILDLDLESWPLSAIGWTAFGVGTLPGLLASYAPAPLDQTAAAVAKVTAQLGFTLTLAALAAWFAWCSRWGRVVLGLAALWTFLAKLPVGSPNFVAYHYMMVLGRGWAAFFSTLTIAAVYLLVKRLYNRTGMALAAAAAFAFAVISIQISHYCITESLITLMCVVVALSAWEIAREGSWRAYLLAGAAFGLSLASKSSSLYYVIMIAVGHLLFLSRRDKKSWEAEERRVPDEEDLPRTLGAAALVAGTLAAFLAVGWKFKSFFHDLFLTNPKLGFNLWVALFAFLAVVGLLLALWGLKEFRVLRAQAGLWLRPLTAAGLAFFLFCLLSPWSLLDPIGFMNSMNYEWNVVSIADACYVLQFKDTPRYLYHLKTLLQVDLWWPLGLAAIAGMVWILVRFLLGLRSRAARPTGKDSEAVPSLPVPFLPGRVFSFQPADALLLSWFVAYFGFIGMWNTKFIRYMVPLIPFFCVFGAKVIFDVTDILRGQARYWVRGVVLAVVLGGSLFYSMAYMAVYRFPHPWIEASVWIYQNIKPGAYILTEHWDDGLPTGVDKITDPRVSQSMSGGIYRSDSIPIYETWGSFTDDTPTKKNDYAHWVEAGDYITISSKKLWYTLTESSPEFRPKGYNKYPVTSRYYRLLFSGQLGYKMVKDFSNFPRLFGWSHPDDMAEESFSVYDHPRSYIFQKVAQVPRERVLAMLSTDDYVRGIDREAMRKVTPENVEAFIEAHRQRLEKSGLLSRLDAEMATPPPADATAVQADEERARREEARSRRRESDAAPVSLAPGALKVPPGVPGPPPISVTKALAKLAENPVLEADVPANPKVAEESWSYQLRSWLTWVGLILLLGVLALPATLRLMPGFAHGAYSLSRILGMLFFAWLAWIAGNVGLGFSTMTCWVLLAVLAALSVYLAVRDREALKAAWRKHGASWRLQEAAFLAAFVLFTVIRAHNPHIHDPGGEGYSGGGEAGMDFGFLASVVRSSSFPPQNMWMAGQPIGYSFYFGHLLMGVLTKTLALTPAVTYNLAVITLFAAIFGGAFGLAYGLSGRLLGGWTAGFLCAAAGNLAGAQQYLKTIANGILRHNLIESFRAFTFDYWGPSRVIPHSINEFPFFSVLFADLHAHTLAMPFAMLFVGIAASLYFLQPTAPLDLKKALPAVVLTLCLGFVFGSLAFFNTWELPVWGALFLVVILFRHLGALKGKVLIPGFKIALTCVAGSALLLGWFGAFSKRSEALVLGGQTAALVTFAVLGVLAILGITMFRKTSRPFGVRLLEAGAFLALLGITARVAWWFYFSGFTPQQNQVLWVWPKLRTALGDLWTIHAAFLSVIVFSFLTAITKEAETWISKPSPRKSRPRDFQAWLDWLLDRSEDFKAFLSAPKGPVTGFTALGLGGLAIWVGASWIHHTEIRVAPVALLFATASLALLALAVFLKDALWAWGGAVGTLLVWFLLMLFRLLPLQGEGISSPLLGLVLPFAALWMAAFLQWGLAARMRHDRPLSFSFVIAGLYFLVLAVLEVLVMKEYLGGEWMRNNSLFKFGYCAWMLGSVAAGAFLPRLWYQTRGWMRLKRESASSRGLFGLPGVAWVLLFLLLTTAWSQFTSWFDTPVVYVFNLLAAVGILVWLFREKSLGIAWVSVLGTAALAVSALSFLGSSGSALSVFGRRAAEFSAVTLFPFLVAGLFVLTARYLGEKLPDLGRRLALGSWKALLALILIMVSIYPLAGSWRKCHHFFPSQRRAMTGYPDPPTLNGLAFIRLQNPHDAAAIRFLNERVPGQPCLAEFVGEGYNSWGSRMSIFTGIPALMGWDGHVGEWVGATQSERISMRRQANEEIFSSTDKERVKRLLDSYGVRLVVVGTLERRGVPGRKGGYPAEGLAKFEGWLPILYQNPGVTIYYNAPGPG